MSIIDLLLTPNTVSPGWRTNTAASANPFIASSQTVDRGGHRLSFVYNYVGLRGTRRANIIATIARLRGQSNRLRVSVADNPKLGVYGGVPLVNGADQTGYTLAIDGCTPSTTKWISEGDYFSVIVNGEPELKIAALDADSDALGNVTLTFEPKLRASPLDNATLYVEDGAQPKPQGIFIMSEPNIVYTSRPGHPSKVTAVSLPLIEDVYATQA